MNEKPPEQSRASVTRSVSKLSPRRRSSERRARGPATTKEPVCAAGNNEPEEASRQSPQETVKIALSPLKSPDDIVNASLATSAHLEPERNETKEKTSKDPVLPPGNSSPTVEAQAAALAQNPSSDKHPAVDLPKSDSNLFVSLFSTVCITGFTLASAALLLALFKEGDGDDVLRVPGLGGFRGAQVKVDDQVVHVFRGIPFGQDTAGKRRFGPPAPLAADSEFIFDVREPKPACVQMMTSYEGTDQKEATSENCLHLNIWTPCTDQSDPGCRLTVLVFFASREFQSGSNNAYDGRWLAGLGQLVVVAPNFRLGAFGFLNASTDDAPGNVGLDDQRLALEWVLMHIASFGGNSSDVVLMGSASGSWSIGAHLTGRDRFWRQSRFSKVILHGEAPLRRYLSASAHDVSLLLQCPTEPSPERLACLRAAPAESVLLATSGAGRTVGPSLVRSKRSASRLTGLRFFVGVTSDEGSAQASNILSGQYAPFGRQDAFAQASDWLQRFYHVQDGKALATAYRKQIQVDAAEDPTTASGSQEVDWWVRQLIADVLFVCPLVHLALELAAERRNEVFGFLFDVRRVSLAPRFSELDFIFGRVLDTSAATAGEFRLSRTLITIWAQFAKRGTLPKVRGKPWPAYKDGKAVHVRITSLEVKEIPDFKKKICDTVAQYVHYELS